MHYLAKTPYANEKGKRQISVTSMTAYEKKKTCLPDIWWTVAETPRCPVD